MLEGKITREWSEGCSRWLYQKRVAWVNHEGELKTELLLGWTADEVLEKLRSLTAALLEERNGDE